MKSSDPFNVIGGAELEEEIDCGGQARVYRANYRNKKVAVKIAITSGGAEIAQKAIARFEREQDMLLSLNHPNIVTVLAAGISKVKSNNKTVSVPYIIMELMSGAVTISRDNPMPWQEVVRIGYDVAQGLSAAHAKGIVHRDIKPANILLTQEGIAKISDFGWAHFLESGPGSIGFTPGYASPEHIDLSLIASDDIPANQVDEISDIYSFGVTLYQMLTGHLPYEGPLNGIPAYLKGNIPRAPFDCAAPKELRDLVESMISLRRDQRPRNVATVIDLLEKISIGSSPIGGRPVPVVVEIEDFIQAEAAVRKYALAFIRPGLFDRILSLKKQSLGGWIINSIYAIGGEGILLLADKKGQPGILKMPNLPYDRPVKFGNKEISALRDELIFEAEMLRKFPNALLPALLDLAEGNNPLLSDRPPKIADFEKFLVMEFIPGKALDLEIQSMLRLNEVDMLHRWLQQSVMEILNFLSFIKSQQPGYFYTDFKPSNIRVAPDKKVHLLDAGSIIHVGSTRTVPTTPGYRPVNLSLTSPNIADLELISLVSLGRAIYSSLLNKVLHDEISMDFQQLATVLGVSWAKWIEQVCTGTSPSIKQALDSVPR